MIHRKIDVVDVVINHDIKLKSTDSYIEKRIETKAMSVTGEYEHQDLHPLERQGTDFVIIPTYGGDVTTMNVVAAMLKKGKGHTKEKVEPIVCIEAIDKHDRNKKYKGTFVLESWVDHKDYTFASWGKVEEINLQPTIEDLIQDEMETFIEEWIHEPNQLYLSPQRWELLKKTLDINIIASTHLHTYLDMNIHVVPGFPPGYINFGYSAAKYEKNKKREE